MRYDPGKIIWLLVTGTNLEIQNNKNNKNSPPTTIDQNGYCLSIGQNNSNSWNSNLVAWLSSRQHFPQYLNRLSNYLQINIFTLRKNWNNYIMKDDESEICNKTWKFFLDSIILRTCTSYPLHELQISQKILIQWTLPYQSTDFGLFTKYNYGIFQLLWNT